MKRTWIAILALALGMSAQVKNQNSCDHAAPPAGMRWVCAPGNTCDCHLSPSKAESDKDDEEFNASPVPSTRESISARIVFFAIPGYPNAARRDQKQGLVSATLVLTPEGNVSEVRIQSGDGALATAARSAWQQWRFTPGDRVESIPVSVKFVLAENAGAAASGTSLLNTVVTASAR